jgi:hypothetical protein
MGEGGLDGAGDIRHDSKNTMANPYGPDGHSGAGRVRCGYSFRQTIEKRCLW